MKNVFSIIIVLLLLIAGVDTWWQHGHKISLPFATSPTRVPNEPLVPAIPAENSLPDEKKVLNLALPPQFLMDRTIDLPERSHDLRNLFVNEDKESAVKLGGRLILEEKSPEPNAAVWDKVKGAEVGITIKTP